MAKEYELRYKETVAKEIKAICTLNSKIAKAFEKKLEEILAHPSKSKELKGSLKGIRTARFGDYRILYIICEKDRTIEIISVGDRKSVYGDANRKYR